MAEAPKPAGRARRRSRRRSAVERVRDASFPVVLRGYDRRRVDKYVAEVAELVAELESNQLSESVVQRALEEVGDQTSGILQQARETAAEIEAQSWSKAEAAVERAERDAEITRREAERYAEQLADDARALWEERGRLIEEMRQLADEVLGTADDALDRLQPPGTDLVEPEFDDDDTTTASDDGGFGADDTTTAGDDRGFGADDTTVADEGVFADESRPGPEEPPPEEDEDEAALDEEAPAQNENDEAALDQEAPAQNDNGAPDEAADVTAVFERPPAERRQD